MDNQRTKRRHDDGFINPEREKRKMWAGIAALVGLVLLFVILLVGAATNAI